MRGSARGPLEHRDVGYCSLRWTGVHAAERHGELLREQLLLEKEVVPRLKIIP